MLIILFGKVSNISFTLLLWTNNMLLVSYSSFRYFFQLKFFITLIFWYFFVSIMSLTKTKLRIWSDTIYYILVLIKMLSIVLGLLLALGSRIQGWRKSEYSRCKNSLIIENSLIIFHVWEYCNWSLQWLL